MNILPIKTGLILEKPIKKIIDTIDFPVENGDVFVFTSKIISYEENNIINLNNIKPSLAAQKLAKKYILSANLCELIIQQSDKILGGVKHAILTLKNNILIANAGIDESNVQANHAVTWPKDPATSAQNLQKLIYKRFKKKTGVIISDSHCPPSRHGTSAIAIGIAGFNGIECEIGKLDLFKKPLKITYHNLADELASAANFLMGESNQGIPAVIIKEANIKLSKRSAHDLTHDLTIDPKKDLFNKLYKG